MTLPDPRTSRAVLIGVGRYDHAADLPLLAAARANVAGLRAVLSSPRHWGLPPSNCVALLDPDNDAEPAVSIAAAADGARDTLLVYFAGHGLVARTGELVLATSRTDPRWPEFSGLRSSWIHEAMACYPTKRKVLIVDCCFGGRLVRTTAGLTADLGGQLGVSGAYVLSATAPNAVAIAPEGARYTAFTGALIDLLTHGVSDGPPLLRLSYIYDAIRRHMVRVGLPQPVQLGTNSVGDLALTRNVAMGDRAQLSKVGRTGDPSYPPYESLPEPGTLRYTALAISIDRYHTLSRLAQVDRQLILIDLLEASAAAAGIDTGACVRQPRPDGELIVFSQEGLGEIVSMIRAADRLLEARNADLPPASRLGLVATLHRGRTGSLSDAAAEVTALHGDTARATGRVGASHLSLVATEAFVRYAVGEGEDVTNFGQFDGQDADGGTYRWRL